MKTIKAFFFLIILAGAGLFAYAWFGFYNVAVGTGHNPVTEWSLEMFRERSIEAHAAELNVPDDLASEARVQAGAGHYNDMCAGCHGFPGREPANVWEPAPPALYNHAEEPAEAFWIIRNGIKMTAMPNHLDHSAADIWDIVAFLQVLPSLSPEQYQAVTATAEHSHANGTDHEHEESGSDSEGGEVEGAENTQGKDTAGSGHSHAPPTTPVATVEAFHHALVEGNSEAALALLHEQATLLEGGNLETKQEYAAGHMAGDMAFLAQVDTELLSRDEQTSAGQSVVTSQASMTGTVDGEAVDVVVTGVATLVKTDAGWLITQMSWTSEPATEGTPASGA